MCVLALLFAGLPTGLQEGRYGLFQSQLESLAEPIDVEFRPDGALWVLERALDRVTVVERDGSRRPWTGGRGGPPELRSPSALAALDDGGCLVADQDGGRIVRFDAEGALREVVVGAGGTVDLELRFPVGLDRRGERLAIADRGLRQVLLVGGGGPVVRLDAGLLEPADVAFVPGGGLAVVDVGLHELLLFDDNGALRGRTGDFGHFPGQLAAPSGVAAHGERLYVTDSMNHRVQVFGPGLELLYEWGKHALRPGQGAGHLHYPERLVVAPDGGRVALLEPFADRLQLFGPAEGPTALYRTDPATLAFDGSGHFGPPVAAAAGVALTIEPESQSVRAYDLRSRSGSPVLVGVVGGYGPEPGSFRGLVDVALRADGARGYALDGRDLRLCELELQLAPDAERVRFLRDGLRFARSLDLVHRAPTLQSAEALALSPQGEVWVLDAVGCALFAVDAQWQQVVERARWTPDSGPRRGVDLALGPKGEIVVADAGERAAWVFEGQGGWRPLGSELEPGGVAFDGDGELWFTERRGHRLRGPGTPGTTLGRGPGLGRLEFQRPRGLAFDGQGRWVVLDHGNHRLQVLTVGGEFVGFAGPRSYVQAGAGSREREGAR
jgi:hypothetical protein